MSWRTPQTRRPRYLHNTAKPSDDIRQVATTNAPASTSSLQLIRNRPLAPTQNPLLEQDVRGEAKCQKTLEEAKMNQLPQL